MGNRIVEHRLIQDPSISDARKKKAYKHLCTVPGCENSGPYLDYCRKHKYRVQKYGDPSITKQMPPGELRRWLEERAQWADQKNCLIWPYATDKGGYPIAGNFKGHSLMCELAHGAKPDGKDLAAHSCDVRNCVNPNHLRWATYQENADDAVSRGRVRRGEQSYTAKLTAQQVREIRAAPRGYGKTKALADKYGVSVGTINHIWRGDGWKHVA